MKPNSKPLSQFPWYRVTTLSSRPSIVSSYFMRKEHHDLTLSLREIAALLPVTGTAHSRRISKKDTLVHVLRYLEYLQSHIDFLETLLPGCDSGPSELRTPPLNRKSAQQESVCSRPRKRQPASRGEGAGRGTGRGACLSQISGPLRRTVPALPVESSEAVRRVDLSEARSSTLHMLDKTQDQYGLKYLWLKLLSGGLLLKDHMLWWYPSSGEDEPPLTPSFPPHPSTGSSPLRTLCFVEGLNLSPSLLTSPARDLALSFLQEGQENLHDSADSRTAMYAACGARGRGSWRGRERDQGRERERGSRRKEEGEQEREEEGAGERERGSRRGEAGEGEGNQERGEAGERDTRREGEQEKEGGEPPQRSDQSRLFRGDSGELLSIGPAAEEYRDRLSVTHY
ncbi:UNVERIFIED_CONTAM: hypothetical protein FKN15_037506 [Acipenser sinensis]